MADRIRAVGAVIVSVFTAVLAAWWLWIVYSRLGTDAAVDDSGVVIKDEFQRAKDILLVVLPLFSAALAYFVGSQGTAGAKEEAATAKTQLDAVLDSSPEGILKTAKLQHPEAFA